MLNTYQFSFPVNKFPHSSTSNIITFSNTHTHRDREGDDREGGSPSKLFQVFAGKLLRQLVSCWLGVLNDDRQHNKESIY